jgi:hypothetical protein
LRRRYFRNKHNGGIRRPTVSVGEHSAQVDRRVAELVAVLLLDRLKVARLADDSRVIEGSRGDLRGEAVEVGWQIARAGQQLSIASDGACLSPF